MPVLQACWSPCFCYNNVKLGTIAVGVFSLVGCLVSIVYAAWVLDGGQSSELYSPFFESDLGSTTKIAGGLFIFYFVVLAISSILMIIGTRHEYRGFLFPYLIWLSILIFYAVSLGIWFSARYYTYPVSTWSSIMTWLFSCVIIYCWLCVFSQYQVLKEYQTGHVVMLYP